MSGIVGVVFFADEVHKVCTPMHIKFFHDLVLELAGSKGGALDSGSRCRCLQIGDGGAPPRHHRRRRTGRRRGSRQ